MCVFLEVLKKYLRKVSVQNDSGTVDSDSDQKYYSRTIFLLSCTSSTSVKDVALNA